MLLIPLDELLEAWSSESQILLCFAFSGQRATTEQDPALLQESDAHELFALALLRLFAVLGLPDFPSEEQPTPPSFRRGHGALAVWDFDYYAVVLEVLDAPDAPGKYRVGLRRQR